MKSYISALLAIGVHEIVAQVNTPPAVPQGFITNCGAFIQVPAGSNCEMMGKWIGAGRARFIELNPMLKDDCDKKIIPGTWYCQGTVNNAARAGGAVAPAPAPEPPKTTAPPPAAPAQPTTQPPPAAAPAPIPTPTCERNNECARMFAKGAANPGPSMARSTFCSSYLAGKSTETNAAKLNDIPVPLTACAAPAELSSYCACWNAGSLTV